MIFCPLLIYSICSNCSFRPSNSIPYINLKKRSSIQIKSRLFSQLPMLKNPLFRNKKIARVVRFTLPCIANQCRSPNIHFLLKIHLIQCLYIAYIIKTKCKTFQNKFTLMIGTENTRSTSRHSGTTPSMREAQNLVRL